jgi:HAMP domain-containing protein
MAGTEDLSPSVFAPRPPEIIDIRPISQPDLETLFFRLERLEVGTRLIVETMKRTYAELASSIEGLAQQLDVADARVTVERIVAEEVGPLTMSVRQLMEAVQRFPHILAAAMDDIGVRVDSGRWKLETTPQRAIGRARQDAYQPARTSERKGRPEAPPRATTLRARAGGEAIRLNAGPS